jgi:hypothetical protein
MRIRWQFGQQAGRLITMLEIEAAKIKMLVRRRLAFRTEAGSRDADCRLALAQAQRS